MESTEKKKFEKKSKEQTEEELRAEHERKRKLKGQRLARRKKKRAVLKEFGFRPNRKMTKDKKTGADLKSDEIKKRLSGRM